MKEFSGELVDFSIEFAVSAGTKLSIDLRGETIEYKDDTFFYGNLPIPAAAVDGKVSLRALIDRASVALFAKRGAAVGAYYAKLDAGNQSVR